MPFFSDARACHCPPVVNKIADVLGTAIVVALLFIGRCRSVNTGLLEGYMVAGRDIFATKLFAPEESREE